MGSDLEIFDSLFLHYRQRLVRFAVTYLADEAAAEDIVMESFMGYWERHSSLAPGTNPAAYIMASVRNRCLNHLRDEAVRRRVREDIQSTGYRYLQSRIETLEVCDPERIFSQEAEQIVRKTLESLPENVRRAFEMSRFDGMTHKRIAVELDIPQRTVEFFISKAMTLLRASLKDYLPALLVLLQLR